MSRSFTRYRKETRLDSSSGTQEVERNLVAHYLDLYQSGIELPENAMNMLRDKGFFSTPVIQERNIEDSEVKINVDYKHFGINPNQPVYKEDWLAHNGNPLKPNEEFVIWIDSQLKGMSRVIPNKQFELYKLQAKQWLDDPDKITNYASEEEQKRFIMRERKRCRTNSLYGLNKYLYMKEGEVASGQLKFTAWEAQAAALWVADCGFSIICGKLRQVGFTTIFMGRTEMRTRCSRNYFCKFIAESDKKTKEIFNDKLKYSYSMQPEWFRASVSRDSDEIFAYAIKDKKGEIKGVNSRIVVESPYPSAINGSSPNEVLIDEIGNIGILTAMIQEGRPAMMWINPETGEFEQKRVVLAWGTAGEMTKGKGQFEVQFRAAMDAWRERDFTHGFVPIFIDCFAKPGITRAVYEEQKRIYYRNAANQVDGEKYKIQFHQHFPVTVEDMFLVSSETLIPISEISDHIDAIWSLPEKEQPMYGRMEAILDSTIETPDLYYPYKIIGASFRPLPIGSPEATVIIKHPPVSNWKDRYRQGSDPVNTAEGQSDMASCIWDAHLKEVSAIMKFRDRDHKYCFSQAMLLGLWYKVEHELIERDIGQDLIDFMGYHGQGGRIMKNYLLPKHLQVSTQGVGISKKGHNATHLVSKLREIIDAYPEGITIAEIWIQLKTYVQKITPNGSTKYERQVPGVHKDDILDALVYAYICAECFIRTPPVDLSVAPVKKKKKMRYRYNENYELILMKE